VVRRFRPGVLLTLLWAAAEMVLLGLGIWQVQRLAWKNELIARAEAAAREPASDLPVELGDPAGLAFRRVRVAGSYVRDRALALGLENRDGRVGARLLAPFRLEDGRTVLVDRGFVREERLREAVAGAPPSGRRVLEGVLRAAGGGSWATPAPDLSVPRWYAADTTAIGRHLGLELAPVVLVLERPEEEGQGLTEPGPVAIELPNPHLGYAVTWFGLAASLLVFYILLGFRAGREQGT
jgi:surfeit locus 1 family protein